MDQLLRSQRLKTSNNVKDFRALYDKIENHLRSLFVLGINPEHCGPMLLPLVLEKLPSDIRLEISTNLGKGSLDTTKFMEALKNEIVARKSCSFIIFNKHKSNKL